MIINGGEETIHETDENPRHVECNSYWKKNDTAKIFKEKHQTYEENFCAMYCVCMSRDCEGKQVIPDILALEMYL